MHRETKLMYYFIFIPILFMFFFFYWNGKTVQMAGFDDSNKYYKCYIFKYFYRFMNCYTFNNDL